MNTRFLVIAFVLATAVLLGGCSGASSKDDATSSSSSSSSSVNMESSSSGQNDSSAKKEESGYIATYKGLTSKISFKLPYTIIPAPKDFTPKEDNSVIKNETAWIDKSSNTAGFVQVSVVQTLFDSAAINKNKTQNQQKEFYDELDQLYMKNFMQSMLANAVSSERYQKDVTINGVKATEFTAKYVAQDDKKYITKTMHFASNTEMWNVSITYLSSDKNAADQADKVFKSIKKDKL